MELGAESSGPTSKSRATNEPPPVLPDTSTSGNGDHGAEGTPPPAPDYTGTVNLVREGTAYDLGYLLDTSLVPPNLISTEHLPAFADDTARDPSHGMDDAARDDLNDQLIAQMGHDMRVFFRDGGHTFTVTNGQGNTWRVQVSLRPENPHEFFHLPTTTDDGAGEAKLKSSADTTGDKISSSSKGRHGRSGTVGVGVTVSPLYVDVVGDNAVGPRLRFRISGGTRSRSTEVNVSTTSDTTSTFELKNKPEFYVADLLMRVKIQPGDTSVPVADPPYTPSPNGLVLALPGGVVPSKGPRSIRILDPFLPVEDGDDGADGDGAGRDGGRLPIDPRAGQSHPIHIGDIRSTGSGTAPSLTDWVTDHLTRADRPPRKRDRVRDALTPSFLDRHPERRARIADEVGRELSGRALRNQLPRMTVGPVPMRLTDVSGRKRIVRMWSVPTDYTRKDHTLQPSDNLKGHMKGSPSTKAGETVLRKDNTLRATVGAGMSLSLDLPGLWSTRVDAPYAEYSPRFQSSEYSASSISGSRNWATVGANDSTVYDVRRNYYLQFDGESEVYRFQGDTIEILTVEDAHLINGEVPPAARVWTPPTAPATESAPATSSESGPPAEGTSADTAADRRPRPPLPNLAVANPTDFTGATPRTFNWSDGSQYRDTGGGTRRSVYEELSHQVLTGLARQRPGLVLPDLARGRADYARRPGYEEAGYLDRSPRERRLLRRNYDIARLNTFNVMKTVSETRLRSDLNDLGLHGVPVHLHEAALVNPASLFRSQEKLVRPKFVTARISASFDALRHMRPTDRGVAADLGGSSGRSTGSGRSGRHAFDLGAGGFFRKNGPYGSSAAPESVAAVSGSASAGRASGAGQGQGIKQSSETSVVFPQDSDVWSTQGTFDARLYERDDIGMVRGGGPPLRERGLPLLERPFQAQLILETPKAKRGADSGTPWAPRADDIRPMPPEDAERVITEHTRADPGRVRRTRDVLSRNRSAAATTRTATDGDAPAAAATSTDGEAYTGDRTDPSVGTGPRNRAEDGAPADTGAEPGTHTTAESSTTPLATTEGGTSTQHRAGESAPGQSGTEDTAPAPRTADQRRAERIRAQAERRAGRIRRLGAALSNVSTRFRVGEGEAARTTSLLDETYQAFSRAPRGWSLHQGFSRKLEHFLVGSEGAKDVFGALLSPQTLSAVPEGVRTRVEMSGGFWSPHHVRTTVATEVGITSIDSFEQSDAMVLRESKTTLDLSRNTHITWSVNAHARTEGRGRLGPDQTTGSGQGTGDREGGAPSTDPDGRHPFLGGGPGANKSLFGRRWGDKLGEKYSQTVSFVSKMPMSYLFTGSGDLTQALEFTKNWSIGPTFPRSARFRGWVAHVRDLVSGVVHIRDAQAAGLVEDRVVERDGELVLEPQPEPETPRHVRVRPGLEDSGKMTVPPDTGPALQALVDDLASQGWELTSGSREDLLHTLGSHLGENPNAGVPLPVRVRAIDHSIGDLNSPTSAPLSLNATVYVRLDTSDPRVEYVSGNTDFRDKHTWESSGSTARTDIQTGSTGVQGGVMQPVPAGGDPSSGEGTPDSRPYLMGPEAGAVSGSSRSRGDGSTKGESRTVDLSVDLPYAKISQNSRVTLDLEISRNQQIANRVLGERPGDSQRHLFTGKGTGGRVETLYPASYLDFSDPASDDAGNGGDAPPRTDTATGDGTAPEHPSNDTHASLHDMMRSWARGQSSDDQAEHEDSVLVPSGVENRGQDIRDTAHVVVAKSLGWTSPSNAVADGRYTPEALRSAREYNARKLGLGSRHNPIDQSLNAASLKALYPEVAGEGAELTRMGGTTWSVRALPDPSSARILDIAPIGRITDSHLDNRSNESPVGHGSAQDRLLDLRPAGRTDHSPLHDPHTGVYHGSALVPTSSETGGESVQGVEQQDIPDSSRARIGPVLLVEFDAKWAVGARSELRNSAFRKAAGYVGDKVRSAFGHRPSTPSRWQLGHTGTKVTAWLSREDAVRAGMISQGAADGLASPIQDLARAQKKLSSAEKTYLKARRDLEPAAAEYADAQDDPRVRDEYHRLEAIQDRRRRDFENAVREWIETLETVRGALNRSAPDGGDRSDRSDDGAWPLDNTPLPPITESPEPPEEIPPRPSRSPEPMEVAPPRPSRSPEPMEVAPPRLSRSPEPMDGAALRRPPGARRAESDPLARPQRTGSGPVAGPQRSNSGPAPEPQRSDSDPGNRTGETAAPTRFPSGSTGLRRTPSMADRLLRLNARPTGTTEPGDPAEGTTTAAGVRRTGSDPGGRAGGPATDLSRSTSGREIARTPSLSRTLRGLNARTTNTAALARIQAQSENLLEQRSDIDVRIQQNEQAIDQRVQDARDAAEHLPGLRQALVELRAGLSQADRDLESARGRHTEADTRSGESAERSRTAAEQARASAKAADDARVHHERQADAARAAAERAEEAERRAQDLEARHARAREADEQRARETADLRVRLADLTENVIPGLESRVKDAAAAREQALGAAREAQAARESLWDELPSETDAPALDAWNTRFSELDRTARGRRGEASDAETVIGEAGRALEQARTEAARIPGTLDERTEPEARAREGLRLLEGEADQAHERAQEAHRNAREAQERADRAERDLERARAQGRSDAVRAAEFQERALMDREALERERRGLQQAEREQRDRAARVRAQEQEVETTETTLREANEEVDELRAAGTKLRERAREIGAEWQAVMRRLGRPASGTDQDQFRRDSTGTDRSGEDPGTGSSDTTTLAFPVQLPDTPPNAIDPLSALDPPPLPGLDPKHPDDGQDPLAFL
ncbi:hypothetical protein ACFHWE_23200, partial [Nocardiopsis sp. LOL_012]